MKYCCIIILIVLLLSCDKSGMQENDTLILDSTRSLNHNTDNNISEIKINDEVITKIDKKDFVKLENKYLISPEKLYEFLPQQFNKIQLEKISSGKSNSGYSTFTTCTGIYRTDNKSIKVRLSDYYDKKFYPSLEYLEKIPDSDATFIFREVRLDSNFIGYIQWHKAEAYGVIELLAFDRYNINIEIDNYAELENNYIALVESFNLQKLKDIKYNR